MVGIHVQVTPSDSTDFTTIPDYGGYLFGRTKETKVLQCQLSAVRLFMRARESWKLRTCAAETRGTEHKPASRAHSFTGKSTFQLLC